MSTIEPTPEQRQLLKTLTRDDRGYLVSNKEWTEEVAHALAAESGLALTEKHWDIITFIQEHCAQHQGVPPLILPIVRAMAVKWNRDVNTKQLYDLFPGGPGKQAVIIAGESQPRTCDAPQSR